MKEFKILSDKEISILKTIKQLISKKQLPN